MNDCFSSTEFIFIFEMLHDLVDGTLNWKSRVRGHWKIFAADTEVRALTA